jgi:protein TonB
VIPEEILPDIVVEPIAERMIEIDQEPVGQTLAEPGSIVNTMPLPEAVIIVNTTPPEDDDPLNTTPLPGEDDTPNTRPPPASGSAVETVSLPEAGGWEEEYLPADRISDMPVFPEAEILAALVYPPAAKRAGIEGRVILALFIHQTGEIRRIDLLSEEPAGRGFGEAARKAFQGIVCEPAKANGQAVSSRIRYPLSFRLR